MIYDEVSTVLRVWQGIFHNIYNYTIVYWDISIRLFNTYLLLNFYYLKYFIIVLLKNVYWFNVNGKTLIILILVFWTKFQRNVVDKLQLNLLQ